MDYGIDEGFSWGFSLMFFLLNPFFMSIYLMDLFHELKREEFAPVLIRGACIATSVFLVFAWAGERVFTEVLHTRFSSFLVFGGLVFVIIAMRFMFQGQGALEGWRGKPEHIAGSIAMPFMVGPGTVGGSVLVGVKMPIGTAALAIVSGVGVSVFTLILLKFLFDYVKTRNEPLVERYISITGRVMALAVGSFAVDMIFQGIEIWLKEHG